MKRSFVAVLGLTAVVAVTSAAYAGWYIDEDGNGFVGKGDVQLALGFKNKQLQDNAEAVQFQVESEVVTEVSWVCTNSNDDNTQERERTTTISLEGVLESVARERNQVTGFNLTGWDGDAESGSETDGPAVNSCPSGPWTLTTPAGEPELVSSTGALQVSIDGTTWYDIP